MKILIFGAGSIGSLFGALLSRNNEVVLIGRKEHVDTIKKRGLKVIGEINDTFYLPAFEDITYTNFTPDIVFLTVKSYDTDSAMKEIVNLFGNDIFIFSLQNGLDNIEKIENYIHKKNLLIGVTTEASTFLEPGLIRYAGRGKTIIGALGNNRILEDLKSELYEAGFSVIISDDIIREVWRKAIINSCINPLTAIFHIKNGELLQNKNLFSIVEAICRESVDVANALGYRFDYGEIIEETKYVIISTSENMSSMLQSLLRGRKTEIDSINGYIYKVAREMGVEAKLNSVVTDLVKIMEDFR